jgi:hypothetical protein
MFFEHTSSGEELVWTHIHNGSQRDCEITKLKVIGAQENQKQDGKLNSVEDVALYRVKFLTQKNKKILQKVLAVAFWGLEQKSQYITHNAH